MAQTPVMVLLLLFFLPYLKAKEKCFSQPYYKLKRSKVTIWYKTATNPFRLAGSEWYTCFPCSAIVGACCALQWLWLVFSGWQWLFSSTWLVGKDMWCVPCTLPLTSGTLGSTLSGSRCFRFFVGEDTSMTLMSGMLACLRTCSEWASCSFFMWLMATAAL